MAGWLWKTARSSAPWPTVGSAAVRRPTQSSRSLATPSGLYQHQRWWLLVPAAHYNRASRWNRALEIAGPFDTPAAAFLPKSHGCGNPSAEVEPAARRPAGQAQRQLAPPPDPRAYPNPNPNPDPDP
eukprot:CAMPEP_0182594774 /NCGR_PEP_ID=MMETSP1324-20130603/80876_1 /TAXON_ID=236786 /ORGANISM="Florenciella sp., Strain RCC1587" /LENGTH=126 /DNA_ID=CAMNT_0024812345 /DNA_START=27 /DNA_END=404 /DNA_ORIENTATION=+